MSIWQLQVAIAGYVAAHSQPDKAKLSKAERDELFEWIEGLSSDEKEFSTMTYTLAGAELVPAGIVTFRIDS